MYGNLRVEFGDTVKISYLYFSRPKTPSLFYLFSSSNSKKKRNVRLYEKTRVHDRP